MVCKWNNRFNRSLHGRPPRRRRRQGSSAAPAPYPDRWRRAAGRRGPARKPAGPRHVNTTSTHVHRLSRVGGRPMRSDAVRCGPEGCGYSKACRLSRRYCNVFVFRLNRAHNLKVVGSNPTPATKSHNHINYLRLSSRGVFPYRHPRSTIGQQNRRNCASGSSMPNRGFDEILCGNRHISINRSALEVAGIVDLRHRA